MKGKAKLGHVFYSPHFPKARPPDSMDGTSRAGRKKDNHLSNIFTFWERHEDLAMWMSDI